LEEDIDRAGVSWKRGRRKALIFYEQVKIGNVVVVSFSVAIAAIIALKASPFAISAVVRDVRGLRIVDEEVGVYTALVTGNNKQD